MNAFGFIAYGIWFWLGAVILFGVLEAVSAGLISIWFVVGALLALIAASLNAPVLVQWLIFLIGSAVALILTRPLVRKLSRRVTPTNADRVLGSEARVTETVDAEHGAVYVDGKTWSARSDGTVFPEGSSVCVLRIEGVKLLVGESQKVKVLS